MARRSPLHVVCQPWPFPPKPGERRHKPICRWVARGAMRGAAFAGRGPLRGWTAVLHPSTKQVGKCQLSLFDVNGPVGDSVRNTCTEALAARDITPNLWKLVEVE